MAAPIREEAVSDLTPEKRCERVRMALAEAGYPPDAVRLSDENPALVEVDARVDDPTLWRAMACAGIAERCWPCWRETGDLAYDDAPTCDHDPLSSPWPEVR